MQGQSLARLAGMMCNQQAFMQYCGATSAEDAAAFVRRSCGVKSRAELDKDQAAAKRFHDMRRAFAYQGKE